MALNKNTHIKLNIFVVLFFKVMLITQGCSSYYSLDKNAQNKIFLRGPGSCTQLILFDDDGSGIALKGRSLSSEYEKFEKLKSIEVANQFEVKKSDRDKFNMLMNKLETTEISGRPKNDARHIEIFINGKKKVDTYNFTENIVMDLLFLLNENIAHDINSFCEPIGVID